MSDLISRLEDADKKLEFLAALRFKRAKRRYMQQKDYKWNGRIKASNMCFESCPYSFYQNINKPEDNTVDVDKSKNHYLMENGKSKHEEFQRELRSFKKDKDLVWLYPPPHIDKIPKEVQFKFTAGQRYGLEPVDCVELPTYYTKNGINMMGFLDGVVATKKRPDEPTLIDFKFKHIADKSIYKNFVKNMLPDLSNITQMAIYKLVVKELGYFNPNPKICGLIYYNTLLIGEAEAEHEFYFNPPLDLTQYLLDTHIEEALKFSQKKESSCTYEFCNNEACPNYKGKRVRWREWLI